MSTIHYPPLRITALFIIIGMGVSLEKLDVLLIVLVLGQIWLAAGRVPARLYWRRVRLIAPLLVFMFLFFPLLEGGDGLQKALLYSGRLLFSVQMLTLTFHRLPSPMFFQSLLRLKIPSIFVEMILFTLRYMDVFLKESKSMIRGYRSRGYRASQWFSLRSYAVLSKVIASLLLRVFRRSERVYLGMLSRGYRGVVPVRGLPDAQPWDKRKAAAMILTILALLVWSKL